MRLKNQGLLDLHNRKLIFELISNNPGIHYRELTRKLELSDSTIRYHINCLVKGALIIKQNCDGYSRFFVSDKYGIIEKKLIVFMPPIIAFDIQTGGGGENRHEEEIIFNNSYWSFSFISNWNSNKC